MSAGVLRHHDEAQDDEQEKQAHEKEGRAMSACRIGHVQGDIRRQGANGVEYT